MLSSFYKNEDEAHRNGMTSPNLLRCERQTLYSNPGTWARHIHCDHHALCDSILGQFTL